ncbi:Peroxisomal membrane protein 4 [Irineochytrium annulatum]|nr:Peroxisomal membrane protein 4 [Irineochytrium annulatum]
MSLDFAALAARHHDLFAIIKGFRNGAVYGAKIRAPHAFVMTFLFRQGTLTEKLRFILKATYQHSKNLAFFVTIYKTLMVLQRLVKGKEDSADAFVAGVVGGYIVFGEDNNINQQVRPFYARDHRPEIKFFFGSWTQIVLYLFSRIMVGMAKLSVKKELLPQPPHAFPVFAAVTWGDGRRYIEMVTFT